MRSEIFEAANKNDVVRLRAILTNEPGLVSAIFNEEDNFRVNTVRVVAQIGWYTKKTVGYGAWVPAVILGLGGVLTGGWGLLIGPIVVAIGGGGGTALALGADDAMADVTYNRQGWTPLHFAAASDSLDAALLLIRDGADGTILDAERRTFLKIAYELRGNKLGDENRFMHDCRLAIETRDAIRAADGARATAERAGLEAAIREAEAKTQAALAAQLQTQKEAEERLRAVEAEAQHVREERNATAELPAAVVEGRTIFAPAAAAGGAANEAVAAPSAVMPTSSSDSAPAEFAGFPARATTK